MRVFVSSTFRDLHAEREELVKRVFPALRARCEQRGVAWSEVDLRWGITDEQQAEGQVLPICLAEIDDCRPFFIGLLGERYGTVPEEIDDELLDREPWLAEAADRSLTELEISHGVLNDPAAAEHARFYFRDPGYLDTLPAADRDAFREGPDAADRADRLARLKERIRASGHPLREGFRTARELGDWVLSDLVEVIDRLFPADSPLDSLDAEDAAQAALQARLRRVHVPRSDLLSRLDAHVAGDGPPLLVVGPQGAGKSALLAEWIGRRSADPGAPVVVGHFFGASGSSPDWAVLVRRVLRDLARRFDLPMPIPEDPELLLAALAEWLAAASAKARVVLVVDGVDQLDDRDGARDLRWLPTEIPPDVRLVVSAAAGRSVTVAGEHGWASVTVEPLEVDERVAIIQEHLRDAGKSLAADRVARIAAAEPTGNPLFLRTLLEELRVFGEHARLDDRIGHYLAAPTAQVLYGLVLQRYEQDYESDRPGLVGATFSALWAARRGLAEAELLDLLGRGGEPLPGRIWSPLHVTAGTALRTSTGLLGFAHDALRDAVRLRYLDGAQLQRDAHRRLADHFAFRSIPELDGLVEQMQQAAEGPFDHAAVTRFLEIRHPRRFDEYPWQLAMAQDWDRLAELLCDPVFLDYAYGVSNAAPGARKADLLEYWSQVEAGSSIRMVDAYRPIIDAPHEQSTRALLTAAFLLHDAEHPAEALGLTEELGLRALASGDLLDFVESLMEQALNRRDLGDPDGAVRLCRWAEEVLRSSDTRPARSLLITLLGNLATIVGPSDPQQALLLRQEAVELAQRWGVRSLRDETLYEQAMVHEARGDRATAIELLRRDERISRDQGDLRALGSALAALADVLGPDDPERALALLTEAIDLARRLGLPGLQLRRVYAQGRILRDQGRADEALAAFRAGAELARTATGGQPLARRTLSHFLGNMSVLLADRGDFDAAERALDEQEAISRETGDRTGLAGVLQDRSFLQIKLGNLAAAMELAGRFEQLARELDDRTGIFSALTIQANLHSMAGDLDEAARCFAEAADAARALGNQQRLDATLRDLIEVQLELDHIPDVRPLLRERAELLRGLDRPADLKTVLMQLAAFERSWGEPELSEQALDELDRIVDRLGGADADAAAELRATLSAAVESAGSICLRARDERLSGRYEEALVLYRKAVDLHPDYYYGWSDLGICLLEMNRPDEAEQALTEAIDRGANDVDTWAPLGAARGQLGDFEGAWECLRICVELDAASLGTRRLAAMCHSYLGSVDAESPTEQAEIDELRDWLRELVEAPD